MIIAALTIIILTVYAWRINLGASLPAVLFCGAWASVYILQSLLARDMYSSVFATLIILTISIFFVVGTGVGARFSDRRRRVGCHEDINIEIVYPNRSRLRLQRVVVIIGILSVLGALQYMRALGLFEAGSLSEMVLMTGPVRVKIFSTNEIQVQMVDKIGFLLAYSGVVLSATFWFFFGWRWWLLVSSMSVLIIGAAQAGRAGTIMILIQWSSVIILKYVSSKNHRIPRQLFTFPVIIFLVFVLGQLLREGYSDTSFESVVKVTHSLRSYFFGGVSAFAYYCDYLLLPTFMSWGKYSFSSLYSALGIAEQAPGVYDFYAPVSNENEISNIYTALRSFIDDFTLLGAMLAFFIIGLVIGYYYIKFKNGDRPVVAILIPLFSFLICSPMASLTYFNSFLLSLFLPYILCRWSFQSRENVCKV